MMVHCHCALDNKRSCHSVVAAAFSVYELPFQFSDKLQASFIGVFSSLSAMMAHGTLFLI
jgi:hypothetical protein